MYGKVNNNIVAMKWNFFFSANGAGVNLVFLAVSTNFVFQYKQALLCFLKC